MEKLPGAIPELPIANVSRSVSINSELDSVTLQTIKRDVKIIMSLPSTHEQLNRDLYTVIYLLSKCIPGFFRMTRSTVMQFVIRIYMAVCERIYRPLCFQINYISL